MRERHTAEQLDWLRENYQLIGVADLTAAYNLRYGADKTPGQIRSTLRNHRIRCGRKTGSILSGRYKLVTPEIADRIRELYRTRSRRDTCDLINAQHGIGITTGQLTSFVKNHRIRSGRDGRYVPGHISWNKDTKGICKANSGTIRPGNIPANRKPLYAERVNTDGYIEISIPERNPYTGHSTRYQHKHVWIWEQAHGPKPDGHAIIFADGNNRNFELDNLLLVRKSELICLNLHGYKTAAPETRETILALARLESAAGFRTIKPRRNHHAQP